MKVSEDFQNNISHVILDGRFDANTCDAVEQFIRQRMKAGRRQFVLNMERVPFTASAGLRVILVIAKELRSELQGDLCIASPQPPVKKVFEISGIDNVLHIFDDVEAAIKSLLE
jgi:anti-anti-sigma factor